ncbi:MAG: Ig-like domain-containing protein [Actinomycetota bacterium]|nr:Ig-like domain-containing protein [Actinomycetota bacterium]
MMSLRRTLGMVLLITLCIGVAPVGADLPPELSSPLAQLQIVSVNAKQARVLDVNRFNRLLALTLALRSRPPAFDGGSAAAVTAPDVLILQEMSLSNVEIFRRLLNQRSGNQYEIVATENSKPKFLINSNTVTLNGEPVAWTDPCVPGSGGDPPRDYFFARFIETTSELPFVVAGVHLEPKYGETGQSACRRRNVAELRAQLEAETTPVIVGGDFNQRATGQFRECDVEEETEPSEWWVRMTAPPEGGKVYVDAVREWHRRHVASMVDEWTHEQKSVEVTCDGVLRNRRTRIDYLFASGAVIAEAHADHPGWAGPDPGTRDPVNSRYSDHRFVWGRFVIAGPPQPQNLAAAHDEEGAVHLTWEPSEGAVQYIVYRAVGKRQYSVLEQVDAAVTSFDDVSTEHGRTYRYAVAPVDASGLQGLESKAVTVEVDTVGPRVIDVDPNRAARRVPRDIVVNVRFNEPIDRLSVGNRTISLTRNGVRTQGVIEQVADEELTFTPDGLLKKKTTYTINVRPVSDLVGNEGRRFTSTFRTASE